MQQMYTPAAKEGGGAGSGGGRSHREADERDGCVTTGLRYLVRFSREHSGCSSNKFLMAMLLRLFFWNDGMMSDNERKASEITRIE